MLSCSSNGEHCDRHPRFLAGLRVDCGCANDHHQLCVVCIRYLRDQVGSGNKPCPITLCRQLIAHCGGSADIKKKLNELIEKLQADQTMTKMDPAMPLPHELTTEIFRFVDSIDVTPKLAGLRVIRSQFLENARKNGWNTDSADFGYCWHGGRDVAVNINESDESTCVLALRPFGRCQQQTCKQRINYFEVKIDRFVAGTGGNASYVDVGLHGPISIGCYGGFMPLAFETRQTRQSITAVFSQGDVIGCGLITMTHRNTKRQQIFFTKNGEINGKTIWSSPFQSPLYPMVSFYRGRGSQVTANFDGNPATKPFLYDLSKISSNNHLQAREHSKGRKRKAAD